jgi:acyl CoA:acetate/3-ketoacid CoA transferase beta subunit
VSALDADSGRSQIADVCWALASECRDDDVLVVGVATPMAAAAGLLARELVAPGLSIIVGGAVDPPLGDIAETVIDPCAASRHTTVTLGQRELLPLLQRGSITLQFVSPAQVDHTGALNTSRVRTADGWRRLPGCLALPDTAAMVGRLIAYRVEGGDRFVVDQVDHITGLGHDPRLRSERGLPGRGVIGIVTEDGRRDIGPSGIGPMAALDRAPTTATTLLDQVIDPHGVLGLESRSGRADAQAALQRLGQR